MTGAFQPNGRRNGSDGADGAQTDGENLTGDQAGSNQDDAESARPNQDVESGSKK